MKEVKLSTVRGSMTAEMDGEVFSLFSFPREWVKGATNIQLDEATLEHLKITIGTMEALIQEAKDAYDAL